MSQRPERTAAIAPRTLKKADRAAHPVAPPNESTFQHVDEDVQITTFSTKIPKNLQIRFKATAAANGVRMQDATAQALRDWIDRNKQ